jgi:peptidoglycan/LPS O-acetylase OafA/YrhL
MDRPIGRYVKKNRPILPTPVTTDNHQDYRADIDGLRAIAVSCVVVFHTIPRLLPGGFVGVDIFFVISGFLISGIIFKALQERRFSYIDFYIRRIKRIFPALLTVLATLLVAGWIVSDAASYSN